MDTALAFQAHALAWLFAAAAVVLFALALCWALNRKWRERRQAELRAQYLATQPSDPDYNQVRALHVDMTIATYGSVMLHTVATDGHASHDSGGGDASSGSDGAGGGSGGD